jgi:hypothetical protein
MKQTKYNLGLLVVALLSVVTLAVAPVSARHGADDTVAETSTSSSSSTTDDSSGSRHSETENENEVEHETENEIEVHKNSGETRTRVAEIRTEAQAKVKELRSGKSTKTPAQLQKICENRKNEATRKLTAFDNSAHKHLVRLNGVYDKLQAYQTANSVTVDGYADLTAKADANKTAATNAVAALDAFKTSGIDCASSTADPVTTLTSIKTTTRAARDALKTYRTSLKNIVVAFAQAKDSTDDSKSTDDNSANTTPTTTNTEGTN